MNMMNSVNIYKQHIETLKQSKKGRSLSGIPKQDLHWKCFVSNGIWQDSLRL
jgi:hypothetical protein